MAVGGPENEVFAAAHAVLARGERPTVERGSPAGRLDQWWELARRLHSESWQPGLSAKVTQAFVQVRQPVTALAQGVTAQTRVRQCQVLAEECEELAASNTWARLEASQGRQQDAEALAARQIAETHLADLKQLLVQRQQQIDDSASGMTPCLISAKPRRRIRPWRISSCKTCTSRRNSLESVVPPGFVTARRARFRPLQGQGLAAIRRLVIEGAPGHRQPLSIR